jgi:transposase InsO family protein/transposase-like protein
MSSYSSQKVEQERDMSELHRTSKDFSKDERARLLSQFESSGLTYQEFAREHNIKDATLKNWIWISKIPPGVRLQRTPVERKKIVEAYLTAQSAGMTRAEFAKVWGISEPSLGTWLKRYEEFGADGLMNGKPKKPGDKRVGTKIPEAVQAEIVRIKKEDPSFGIKKIKDWMYRFSGMKVSSNTISKTVKASGLKLSKIPKKKKKSSDRVRRFERAKSMQMWQSDITQFTMGPSSARVYLTVFMDDHSRFIVAWRLMSRQTADLVMDSVKDGIVRFGKPEEILTDQGRQYFAWRGKSDFEKFLEKEGIKHVVSRAHHPQTLGKCERFWETVMNEFWTRAKPQDLDEARLRLKYFIDHYNHHRPHQGLSGAVPADRFFGVASEIRAVIEKTVESNALKMAIGELPKPPAFLIGQVGDQRIAFHGTSGAFFLTHENLSGANGNGNSVGSNVIDISAQTTTSVEKSSSSQRDIEVPVDPNQRAMGSGDIRGADSGAGDGPSVHGVLDGSNDEASGLREVEAYAGKVLADVKSGGGWNDGGAAHPAALPEELFPCQW